MKSITKIILSIMILFLIGSKIQGQISASASFIKPSGLGGYLFKPTFNTELYFDFSEDYSRFRFRSGIGFIWFKMREDSIKIWEVPYLGNFNPGTTKYDHFWGLVATFQSECKILKDEKISPFIGVDLSIYFLSLDHHTVIYGISDTEISGRSGGVGIFPKIGVSWEMKDFNILSTGFGKSWCGFEEGEGINYWKTYIMYTCFLD